MFWTLLTIQQGVIASHDSYLKCYVKTEAIGVMGTPLGGAQTTSLDSWIRAPLDTNTRGTSTPGGLQELRAPTAPPNNGAWLCHGPHLVPPGLRPTPEDATSDRYFPPALALWLVPRKLPLSVCNLLVTLLAYWGGFP